MSTQTPAAPLATLSEPSFTVGVEEEYHLVDIDTRDLAPDPPASFLADCEAALGDRVTPEFQRSQIEVRTRKCATPAELKAELVRLRSGVARAARGHGMAPLATSIHPFADWRQHRHTDKERYNALAHDLQVTGRQLLISGMHVHVAIEDDDLRIDLMNQMRYFLPHLLALATSSPFWRGELTGHKTYRLAVYDQLPRTGLPGIFASWHEYRSTVEVLVRNGVIEDASKIWWDIRPSARFPTLEMRVTDVCTRVDDAVCVAMLYRCLARMLYRLRRNNSGWRQYPIFLMEENRWRARRYGMDGGLFDFGRGTIVPYADLVEEILALIREDAEHFDCLAEVEHARRIVRDGTSADHQIAFVRERQAQGESMEPALRALVDTLLAATEAV
jgi:carboxylate-amine ligase